MTDDSAGKSQPNKSTKQDASLRDELGIEDLSDPVMDGRGRLFSAAGRESPIAEFTEEFVILHPPQKPFSEEEFDETITERVSPRGVLLTAIGNEVKIPGAKFRSQPIFCLGARDDETGKRLVAYFDESGSPRYLIFEGQLLTYYKALGLRNKTHNGEISNTAGLISSADVDVD
jgi:hypothetical protein